MTSIPPKYLLVIEKMRFERLQDLMAEIQLAIAESPADDERDEAELSAMVKYAAMSLLTFVTVIRLWQKDGSCDWAGRDLGEKADEFRDELITEALKLHLDKSDRLFETRLRARIQLSRIWQEACRRRIVEFGARWASAEQPKPTECDAPAVHPRRACLELYKKTKGITLDQIGENGGPTAKTIRNWAKGITTPNHQAIRKAIARAAEVPLSDIPE
jgi:hypothetical protein